MKMSVLLLNHRLSTEGHLLSFDHRRIRWNLKLLPEYYLQLILLNHLLLLLLLFVEVEFYISILVVYAILVIHV